MVIKRLQIKIPSGRLRQKEIASKPFYKSNDFFAKLRSSARWQDLRFSVLSEKPICETCGKTGACEVHHIIEAHVNPDLFFNRKNLAAVCEDCHKKIHAAYRRGIKAEMLFNNKLKGKGNE